VDPCHCAVRRETEDKPCGVKHKAARKKGGAKAFRTPTILKLLELAITVTRLENDLNLSSRNGGVSDSSSKSTNGLLEIAQGQFSEIF